MFIETYEECNCPVCRDLRTRSSSIYEPIKKFVAAILVGVALGLLYWCAYVMVS